MATNIGERIERQREHVGLGVLALSRETGIAPTTYKRKVANPGSFRYDELERIADALGFNPLADDADRDGAA
jgi:hypothetical protein